MNNHLSKLLIALIISLMLLAGLHLTLAIAVAAHPVTGKDSSVVIHPPLPQLDLTAEIPIISDTISQDWIAISGDCVAFRDEEGGVYLHHLTQTLTISEKTEPDGPRKLALSQGLVVWRSDRPGEEGLWGYYYPHCSDAGIFGSQTISPFHIINRTYAHAPALSGEMLTYMAWVPAGMWYIGLIELDTDKNGIPDAIEKGYDPTAADLWTRLSCCASWPQGYAQVLPDIYWDDDYKIACWYDNAGGDHLKCYDLSHDDDHDGLLDWQENNPAPWTYQFRVSSNTEIDFDWRGILAVHRDLLIWTDARDSNLSGHDLYIVDLDLDNDGILNYYDDPSEGQTEFVLVNQPGDQRYPDIWWPFVVWTDRRYGNQEDIYAYDLSLDSDGDGIFNWKDPDRFCHDPAEFRVTFNPAAQTAPELWNGTLIWKDARQGNWDIFGAQLLPRQPQPRIFVGGTALERAVYWLDRWTIHFPQPKDIAGYNPNTGQVIRYKTITAPYEAIPGAYVVGYDYCYYGTPNQKRFLGRFGRGFTYDQGLALIARTMLAQPAEAKDLAAYMSSFQNSNQITGAIPGSFGFAFNGQGFWGEKDSFYDLDYLRNGANAWLGYGYLFYGRYHKPPPQFESVAAGIGDYLVGQQVRDPKDPRYGLFTGGYGGYYAISGTVIFSDTKIEWVSTEHNIDIYFYLRDLGQWTGDRRYIEATDLLKRNMSKLWGEDKGRLHQGMGMTGTLDTADALDAASWGAMYWLAVGDLEKTKRSLAYVDYAYRNTVTLSPTLSTWAYKPYTGTVDGFDWSQVELVWSEGTLGVAMASLKLGYALLDRCDPQGNSYIQKARNIVTEMEKLQTLDPDGGLFYAIYQGDEIEGFPRAPSAAGTLWLLMVQKALEDRTWGDAFWGADKASTLCVNYLPVISKSTSR